MAIVTTIDIVWRICTADYLKKKLNEHYAGDQRVAVSPVWAFVKTMLTTLVGTQVIQDKQGCAWIRKSA